MKIFFRIAEILLLHPRSDLKKIADRSHSEIDDVSDALEAMLDAGIASELGAGECYSLSDDVCFASLDFSTEPFMFSLCRGGVPCIERKFVPDDRYFYDENVIFFMREASLIAKKEVKDSVFFGCAVILPDGADAFRGTKSILKDEKRITACAEEMFRADYIEAFPRLTYVKRYIRRCGMSDRVLLCLTDSSSVVCSVQRETAFVKIGKYDSREIGHFAALSGAELIVTDSPSLAREIVRLSNVEVITEEKISRQSADLSLTKAMINKHSDYLEKDSRKWKNTL